MDNNDLNQIINQYIEKGFGSMNKNDFEVFIFGYLLKNRFSGMSDNAISLELRIPQTKVKRLRYESSLKMGTSGNYSESFDRAIRTVRKKEGSQTIQFAVEDLFLRRYLDDILKKDGRFFDSSFNSEIVSLSTDDFEYLINVLCPEKTKKEIEHKFNGKMSFKEAVSKFISEQGPKMIEKTLDLSFSALGQWAISSII